MPSFVGASGLNQIAEGRRQVAYGKGSSVKDPPRKADFSIRLTANSSFEPEILAICCRSSAQLRTDVEVSGVRLASLELGMGTGRQEQRKDQSHVL